MAEYADAHKSPANAVVFDGDGMQAALRDRQRRSEPRLGREAIRATSSAVQSISF